MKWNNSIFCFLGGAASVLVLGFSRMPSAEATAQEGKQPFASSIEQRQQTVEELHKMNALLQKQIDILTSGKVRVIVVDEKAEGGKR